MFVNTCSEKWEVAIASPGTRSCPSATPALRVFDAGVGDGTILSRVMRTMHDKFATMPFYVVGKEISLEDVRLTLQKMPDRFYEHRPQCLFSPTCSMQTPLVDVRDLKAASSLVWHEFV